MFKYIAWLLVAVSIGCSVLLTYYIPDMPQLDPDRWWGLASPPNEMIADIKHRINTRRPLTPPLEGIQSEYGMNTVYLEKVLSYWTNEYDFKKRAELLNRFPHFKTKIQGLDIHFIRVKPTVKSVKVLPLLMLHGWPSSSKEFDQMIPMITTPKEGYEFVFEVIAADLPGFGFSEATSKPGLNPVQIGIIMRNLIKRLGFKQYYILAGDWGSQAATHLATIFPDEVLGFHTQMPLSSLPISIVKIFLGSLVPSWTGDHYERLYPLRNTISFLLRETGYFHILATKPDTLGVSVADSPSGLAAFLIEKLAVGTNRDQLDTPHGGLENLNLDDVLDTLTIQWVNNCIVSSMRVYAEAFAFFSAPDLLPFYMLPTKVPTAAIKFPYEIMHHPDWVLRDKFPNLVRSTTVDYGGHFAALEVPQVLADDVFAAGAEFLKFHEANKKI